MKSNNTKSKWSYGTRKESSDYGPYICDIYFGLKKIDYHTCCTSKKGAIKLGKFWVDWLERCDRRFKYDPTKYKNWVDWYSITYSKSYGSILYPSKT